MKREQLGKKNNHLLYKKVPFNAKKNQVLDITLTYDIFQVSLMEDFFFIPILQSNLQIKTNLYERILVWGKYS